jgi:hypothetical protein
MDEPTSGLASTDSGFVVDGLHGFSNCRRTIIAVIHQPRYTVRRAHTIEQVMWEIISYVISSGITHYPVGLTAPPPKSISA